MVKVEQRIIGRRERVAHLAQLATNPKVSSRVVPHTIQGQVSLNSPIELCEGYRILGFSDDVLICLRNSPVRTEIAS
jgi:hypothetical protein